MEGYAQDETFIYIVQEYIQDEFLIYLRTYGLLKLEEATYQLIILDFISLR
jgi:hypothetical protein